MKRKDEPPKKSTQGTVKTQNPPKQPPVPVIPTTKTRLPAPIDDNDFDPGDRLLHGILAKWDAEKKWHDRDGLPLPSPMLVFGITQAVQRFHEDGVETHFIKPLPNVDELNAAVPKSEWPIGFNGQPRFPYALYDVVYLLNPIDAQDFTYLNCTDGCALAVDRLRAKIKNMRAYRGEPALCPIVTLSEVPWKTKYGMKLRPDFPVTDWRLFGAEKTPPPQLAAPTPKPLIEQDNGSEPDIRGTPWNT
jgi:hypothetical protein